MQGIFQRDKNIMAFLYSNNYEELQDKCAGNRRHPEHRVSDWLFYFGLVVEAIAIVYTVAHISISDTTGPKRYFYEITHWDQWIVYFLALTSLIVHQFYIRNNIKAVTEIVVLKYGLKYKKKSQTDQDDKTYPYDFFPANLLFSRFEQGLRFCYFFLLAVIAGEIPYLLMVGEEISHEFSSASNTDYVIYPLSTKIFIFSCAILCLIVIVWDILILISFKVLIKFNSSKANEDQLEIPYSIEKIRGFIFSDSLSLLIWGCILAFIFSGQEGWINTGLMALSVIYFATITYRTFSKKGKAINVK